MYILQVLGPYHHHYYCCCCCCCYYYYYYYNYYRFYGPLSGTTRVSRYQKKYSPTHHPDRHPIFISFFHLLRSMSSSLFIVSHNLCPSLLWFTSWFGALYLILHKFLCPVREVLFQIIRWYILQVPPYYLKQEFTRCISYKLC